MLNQVQDVIVGAYKNIMAPVVIDRIEAPFGTPRNQHHRNHWLAVVSSKLDSIKSLPRQEIPKAIVELFDHTATEEFLGLAYSGDVGSGNLDRLFMAEAMELSFKRLGFGSYSYAFELDNNWIIKLNCGDVHYNYKDAGYDWALACIELTGNIFTPVIAALHQKDQTYCMIAERLTENDMYSAPDCGCFLDLAETYHDDFDFCEYISDMMDYPTFVAMAAMNRDHLIQLCKKYESVSVNTNCVDDLADFNLMVRGRIPIINDPFSDSKSDALTKGKSFSWAMADV